MNQLEKQSFWSKITKITYSFFIISAVFSVLMHLKQNYFEDEHPILLNVIQFLTHKTLIPVHAKYPTFFSYVSTPLVALSGLLSSFGQNASLKAVFFKNYLFDRLILVRLSRVFSVSCFLATGLILAKIENKISKTKALGLPLSLALLFANAKLGANMAYALPDPLLMLLSALVLWFSILILFSTSQKQSRQLLSLLAAVWGLALSTKYSALPLGATYSFALFLVVQKNHEQTLLQKIKTAIRLAFIDALICVAVFLLGSPTWILKPEVMINGLLFEMNHAKQGHLGSSGVPVLGNLELLIRFLPLPILFLVTSFFSKKISKPIKISAFLLILTNLIICSFNKKQSIQYFYPCFPAIFLLAVLGWRELYEKRFAKVITNIVLIVLTLITISAGAVFLKPNTIGLAQKWIGEHLPADQLILLDRTYVPIFYSTSEIKSKTGQLREIPNEQQLLAYVVDQKDLDWVLGQIKAMNVLQIKGENRTVDFYLKSLQPEYFVTSEPSYQKYYKPPGVFTRLKPDENTELGLSYINNKSFYDTIFDKTKWRQIKSFETGNGPKVIIFQRIK